jgi:glucosamine 6-phosphate synthetase-like amidotransferase/phosphosugar isomerase protein
MCGISGITHDPDRSGRGPGQIAELRPGSVTVTDQEGTEGQPARLTGDWDLDATHKDGHDDHMSKEMHERAEADAGTLLDRLLPDGTLVLDEVHLTTEEFSAIDKVFIVACGSSYHAGWVPGTQHLFAPIVDVAPLQMFAYSLARLHGHDVDRPRNLAKVVTVE